VAGRLQLVVAVEEKEAVAGRLVVAVEVREAGGRTVGGGG
jgi:hypothetical protein